MAGFELEIDVTGLMEAGIGAAGVADSDLDALAGRAEHAVEHTLALREQGNIGFLDLPDDRDLARETMEFASRLSPDIDTMVILGIGGSSLGPHALYSALARPFDPLRERAPGMPRRLFFPDNVDPVTVAGLFTVCAPERTLFNVVTKSGTTAETAAQFMVVFERLRQALDEERMKRHLVATTDPEKGALRRVVDELGIASFPIPKNVGGRFSVLSAVGLLPAAVAGLDVTGVLEGALAMRDRVASSATGCRDVRKNPALLLASLLYLHHTRKHRPMTVVMPYVDALYDSADWFRQLWAESLGKAVDVDGRRVHVGPTPIAARGATDQHSQLQLYADGPDDKVFVFMSVAERAVDVPIPHSHLSAQPEYAYLAGQDLGFLLDAEMRGTIGSLRRRHRPCATIVMNRLTGRAMGELFMLFEAATAFAGSLYHVNPYDQPGVEEAKRLAYGALGREGYAEYGAALESGVVSDARYVL